MKNVRDAGFSRKRGGNAGSGPPPSRPSVILKQFLVSLSVFNLIPDLLFDCSRVFEYAKIRTVLQSRISAIKFDAARIHFLSDVYVFVLLKLPL